MPLSAQAREERAAWLRLVLSAGIGPASQRKLLEAFGLPEDVLAAGRTRIAALLDAARAQALLGADELRDARIAAALDWAEHDDHHLLILSDAAYPPRLLAIGDPPLLLFVRGDPARLGAPALAIVGSRQATQGGIEIAQAFGRALADRGLVICSGLAEGIDAAAHRGALAGRAGTVAVLGTGVDRPYPGRHAALADAIAARGAVVSELPLGTEPQRGFFPRRNRLIAGLSLGVLVVEAARQSGSLITARQAAEFGREVMAIPGSIHSPVSKGCHQLIREGAKLVEAVDDILTELKGIWTTEAAAAFPTTDRGGWSTGRGVGSAGPSADLAAPSPASAVSSATAAASANSVDPADPADPAAAPAVASSTIPPTIIPAVLAALGWDPTDIDTIAARTGQPLDLLNAALLELELAGRIERCPDGRWLRADR